MKKDDLSEISKICCNLNRKSSAHETGCWSGLLDGKTDPEASSSPAPDEVALAAFCTLRAHKAPDISAEPAAISHSSRRLAVVMLEQPSELRFAPDLVVNQPRRGLRRFAARPSVPHYQQFVILALMGTPLMVVLDEHRAQMVQGAARFAE